MQSDLVPRRRSRKSLLAGAAVAGAWLVAGRVAAATPELLGAPATGPADVAPDAASTDLQLVVNMRSGDVYLQNFALTPTEFTEYGMKVLDGTTHTLLVGNPADVSKGSGPTNMAPRTEAAPYTREMLLSETNSSSPSFNSSAAALGNNPSAWRTFDDGYNFNAGVFALGEDYGNVNTSDAITVPVGGSVDLGTIFNTFASRTDLQFTWSPAASDDGNYQGNPYTGTVDYVVPEPGVPATLGLAGLAVLRRRGKPPGTPPNRLKGTCAPAKAGEVL